VSAASETSSKTTSSNIAPRDGIYRRGFGLKSEITSELEADYHSEIVEAIRANGNRLQAGGLEIRIAKEFGFCYGVDKAVDFAYEARRRFPDRRIFLTAEIIHNPRVNNRLLEMGFSFLSGQYACGLKAEDIQPEDVVILPAFGVAIAELEEFRRSGCILVDTTCGSVVHVWKRVEKYAQDGFTSLIHGKYRHEETIATASHAMGESRGGQYIVVLDKGEAQVVCDFIRKSGDAGELKLKFERKVSPGFEFGRDLARIGVANQTTMLSSESLEIGQMVREAMIERYGAERIDEHFRSFDTICNATQERQDAVLEMMKEPPDLMLVIGGYNSSNTHHLLEIALKHCPAYHIDEVACLISKDEIRHMPLQQELGLTTTTGWLPDRRPLSVGLTAGASTPNRVIGEAIERLASWTE